MTSNGTHSSSTAPCKTDTATMRLPPWRSINGKATSSEHTPVAETAAYASNFRAIMGISEIDSISRIILVNMASVASSCAACSPICEVFRSNISTDDNE